MPTLNYTTSIAATKSIGEMQDMLAKHGANQIAVSYEGGRPAGVAFSLPTAQGARVFSLPVDVAAVHRLLTDQRAGRNGHRANSNVKATPEQAERVAWRVARDWLAAQLAIIEAGMAALDQVMLPYLQWDGGQTLYQAFKSRETLEIAQ